MSFSLSSSASVVLSSSLPDLPSAVAAGEEEAAGDGGAASPCDLTVLLAFLLWLFLPLLVPELLLLALVVLLLLSHADGPLLLLAPLELQRFFVSDRVNPQFAALGASTQLNSVCTEPAESILAAASALSQILSDRCAANAVDAELASA